MIIGIEQTTDMDHQETKIIKLRSEKAAIAWIKKGGGFAWPGAAREDIPSIQRNWHQRLRYAYEMPPGFRISKKEIEKEWCTGDYRDQKGREAVVWRRHAIKKIKDK